MLGDCVQPNSQDRNIKQVNGMNLIMDIQSMEVIRNVGIYSDLSPNLASLFDYSITTFVLPSIFCNSTIAFSSLIAVFRYKPQYSFE